jgi:hypothetical protein
MATWTFAPLAGDINHVISAKLGASTSAKLTDNDIGKPLKLLAAGRYGLCSDGDNIDGFLVGVDPQPQDGYAFGSVQIGGRVYAQLEGSSTFGYVVEAGTTAAYNTAEASGYGQVSSHAGYALTTTDTVDEIRSMVLAKKWRIISGAVTDDAIVLLEKQ